FFQQCHEALEKLLMDDNWPELSSSVIAPKNLDPPLARLKVVDMAGVLSALSYALRVNDAIPHLHNLPNHIPVLVAEDRPAQVVFKICSCDVSQSVRLILTCQFGPYTLYDSALRAQLALDLLNVPADVCLKNHVQVNHL